MYIIAQDSPEKIPHIYTYTHMVVFTFKNMLYIVMRAVSTTHT